MSNRIPLMVANLMDQPPIVIDTNPHSRGQAAAAPRRQPRQPRSRLISPTAAVALQLSEAGVTDDDDYVDDVDTTDGDPPDASMTDTGFDDEDVDGDMMPVDDSAGVDVAGGGMADDADCYTSMTRCMAAGCVHNDGNECCQLDEITINAHGGCGSYTAQAEADTSAGGEFNGGFADGGAGTDDDFGADDGDDFDDDFGADADADDKDNEDFDNF